MVDVRIAHPNYMQGEPEPIELGEEGQIYVLPDQEEGVVQPSWFGRCVKKLPSCSSIVLAITVLSVCLSGPAIIVCGKIQGNLSLIQSGGFVTVATIASFALAYRCKKCTDH